MRSRLSLRQTVALAKNSIVFAAVFVVVLLGLTAGVLVFAKSVRGGTTEPPKVVVEETSATFGPTSKTAEASGVRGRAKQVTQVHAAPGPWTRVLGTIAKDGDAVIDGRSNDARWYRVIYPPGAESHGWTGADALTVTGEPSVLVVATPQPPVLIDVPAAPPQDTAVTSVSTTEKSTATALPELPDLVVDTTPTITGGKLTVRVVNQGRGAAQGDLVVAVFNPDQTQLLGGTTLLDVMLESGRGIDVDTGIVVSVRQTLLVIVNPNDTIAESDPTNDRAVMEVEVQVDGATPAPAGALTVGP